MIAVWCAIVLCVVGAACSGTSAPRAAGPENPSAAAQAEAYAEALAAEGWPEEVVVEAELLARAGLEAAGSSGEFVPVPAAPRVRVVAFGSLDGDGRSDPGPLAGVTVIAVPDRSWSEWWSAIIGLDLYDDPLPGILRPEIALPVGGQLHADEQQVLSGPGAVVSTTGADGTAEMWLNPGDRYAVCVLSPDVDGLIAGCEYDFWPGTRTHDPGGLFPLVHDAVMVYFSHGRAYLGRVRDIDDPTDYYELNHSYWFQQIAQSMFSPDWSAPAVNPAPQPQPQPGRATIDFYSFDNLSPGQVMAFIEDSRVGAWWDAISAGTIHAHVIHARVDAATVESSPAILVPLQPDPAVYEKFLATVTVDAGVYLVCWLDEAHPVDGVENYDILLCVYEEFPAGSQSYLNPGPSENYHFMTNNRGYNPER